jgi:hypothetical protein
MSGRRVSDTAIACLLCGIGSVVFGCIGLPLGVAGAAAPPRFDYKQLITGACAWT